MNINISAIISLIILTKTNKVLCLTDGKGCHFNDAIFNPKVFHNNAYWKCYENFSGKNRLQKVYCLVEHDALNYTVPGFLIREKCIPFDYRSSSISGLVQSSLSNDTFASWIKCCHDAEKCCMHMMENYNAENFFNTCDAHWDGANCFDETEPGGAVEMNCPYNLRRYDDSKCDYSYEKICQPNGTWTKSDFTQCYQNERLKISVDSHLLLACATLFFCLPPILSFVSCNLCHKKYFKTLIALIIFVTLRSIFELALVSLVYTNSMTLSVNSMICKTLVALSHFTGSMSYTCLSMITLKMLQIVKNMSSGSWGMFMFMSMTLLLSILSTIIWSFAMKIFSDKFCWIVDDEYHWIYDGVRIAIISIAILFLTLSICHRSEQYDKHIILFTKIMIIPMIIFTLPLIISMFSSICGWNDAYRFIQESLKLLQALSLCVIYFLPLPRSTFKSKSWSSTKISSQNSNASLVPSRLSNTRDDVYVNWFDPFKNPNAVACYDNDIVYENISTLPEPYRTDSNQVVYATNNQQRHTIRQVMLRAKKCETQVDRITPKKCSMPPIPKIIPNQILDDVQLFDAYYRSLDAKCVNSDAYESKEPSKRISIKNFGKVFMMKNSQHKNLNGDAASSDD